MTEPFTHHRDAALALLSNCYADLSHKAAGFLGHICVTAILTERQREWLAKLLKRNGLPPLFRGGAK